MKWPVTPDELTGRARTHVVELTDPACVLHVHAVTAFKNMRAAALTAGFDVRPQSSFRGFDQQMAIWNGKFSGARPLYDPEGRELDTSSMTASERIGAILLWSALPGASRHHWGTDLDLIDAAAIRPGYRVRLVAEEFAAAGPFAGLSAWLGENAARFGFFRPFRGVLSGVQPEPWHFSFAPLAEHARRALSPAVLRAALASAPLLGREEVLAQLDELHARYVAAIDWP